MSVSASNSLTMSYQWKRDGISITGAVSNSLTLSNVGNTDAGDYTVEVTNTVGTTVSAAIKISVISPPTITGSQAANPLGSPPVCSYLFQRLERALFISGIRMVGRFQEQMDPPTRFLL
jgi:hypothetical protein